MLTSSVKYQRRRPTAEGTELITQDALIAGIDPREEGPPRLHLCFFPEENASRLGSSAFSAHLQTDFSVPHITHEQGQASEVGWFEASVPPAETPVLPSAENLDAVAAEKKVVEDTATKPKGAAWGKTAKNGK